MAFRAQNQALSDVFTQMKRHAIDVEREASGVLARAAAGDISGSLILALASNFSRIGATLDTLAATPGIIDYAKQQENDASYDIVAEFSNFRAALTATIEWVRTNYPQANGYIQHQVMNADGTLSPRMFTPAQTASLRAVLASLVDTIE